MKNNFFNRVINKGASRDFNGGRTGVDTTVKHLSLPLRRGTKGVCLRKVVSLLFVMLFAIPQMWGAANGTYSNKTTSTASGVTTIKWDFGAATTGSARKIESGTTDNGIIFINATLGNQQSASSGGLSNKAYSEIWLPVSSLKASGTVSMTTYSTSDKRWLQLYVGETAAADTKRLWSKYSETPTSDGKKGPQSFAFTSSDLTKSGENYYLKFESNNTEMKIATLSIAESAAATYSVTYDANGATSGTVPVDDTEYDEDDDVTVKGNTESLKKTGYDFAGWNTKADGTGTTFAAGTGTFKITQDTTLYAKWTAKTTVITLNKNGGSDDGVVTATYGQSLPSFTALSYTGHDLLGYFTAETEGTKIINADGSLVANTDYADADSKWKSENTSLSLYAQWQAEAPKHAISYANLNGASVEGYPTQYAQGIGIDSFDELDDLDDYHFTGWNPTSIPATATDDPFVVAATWLTKNTVSYNANGGSNAPTDATKYYQGQEVTLAAATDMSAPSGKAFDKWICDDADVTISEGKFTMPDKAVIIKATWKSIPTVLFSMEVASGATGKSVDAGTTIALTSNEATITGGTVNFKNNNTSARNVGNTQSSTAYFMLEKTGSYFEVNLSNAPDGLEEGDTIYASVYGGKDERGIFFTASNTVTTVTDYYVKTSSGAGSNSEQKNLFYVVKEGDDLVGKSTFYVERYTGNSTYFKSFRIIRPAAKEILSIVGELLDVKVAGTSVSEDQLAEIKANHTLTLSEKSLSAPEITFVEKNTITYIDFTTKTKTQNVAKTAAEPTDKFFVVSETINDVEYIVKAPQKIMHNITYAETKDAVMSAYPTQYEEGVGVASFAALADVETVDKFYQFLAWSPASIGTDATKDVTITATWKEVPAHNVTYRPGDGTGTAGGAKGGEGFTITVAACTYEAPEGKTFRHWTVEGAEVEGKSIAVPGQTFTMPGNDVTFTAYYDVQHTVTFKDGEETIGSANVWDGEKLVVPAEPQKPLATLDKWMKDDVEYNFDTPVTESFSLLATWNKTYALDIDFENNAGTAPDISTFVSEKNYALSSLTNVTWDNNSKYQDKGLKIKNSGTTLTFNVKADKLVAFYVGSTKGAKFDGVAIPTTTSQANLLYAYSAEEKTYTYQTTTSEYNILKAITITDPYEVKFDAITDGGTTNPDPMYFKGEALEELPVPTKVVGDVVWTFAGWFDNQDFEGDPIVAPYTPAGNVTLYAKFTLLSEDTSLKTLKYGDTDIEIVEKQTTYNVVLPYKTAIPASVTYEANSEVATPAGEQTANVEEGTATFTITAENPEKTATYTVNFTVAPKDGVSIIKGQVTGDNKVTITVGEGTGAASAVKSTSTYGDETGYKLNSRPAYIGIALAEGQFQAGDVVNVFVTTVANGGDDTNQPIRLYYGTNTDNLMAEGTSAMVQGVNTIVLTNDPETDAIYLCRGAEGKANENWNPYIAYIEVLRPMNPILKSLTVAGVDATIDEEAKTISVKLVNGTDPATAELVPVIIANDDAEHKASAALDGTLAYNTPINYVVTDKDGDQTIYSLTATEGATPAAVPTITTQPASHNYLDTEVIQPLKVEAFVSDGGELSYQWYKGEETVGENLPTYTPTEAGDYKVVVTNTLGEETASVTSDVATITITHIYTFASWDGTSATFTKEGEWTMYSSANSGKEIGTTTTFKAEQQIKYNSDEKANVNYTNYVTVVFAKDMKAIQFQAYNSSSRTLNNIYTLDVSAKKLTDVSSKYTKASSQESTTRVSTMNATGHFEAGVYYVFKLSGSCNVFEFFTTEATIVDEFAGLTAGKIDGVDMTDAQLAELNGDTHTLTLTEPAIFAPAVEFTYKHTQTFDDEFVKTVLEATEAGVAAEVSDNFEVSKEFESTTYKVVCPIDRTPAMSLSVETMDLSFALSVATEKSATVTLNGLNLNNGEYFFGEMPNGLSITPASFIVANGKVEETFTVKFAATDRVATATKEIVFSDGTTSKTLTVTYGAVATYTRKDVSETMSWDWTLAGNTSDGFKATEDGQVMANINGIQNVEGFKSQALVMNNGDYAYRDNSNKCFQGKYLMFHTTIPGMVTINARRAGGKDSESTCDLTIGTKNFGEITTTTKNYSAFVEAGDVVISVVGNQPIRIYTMTFTAAEVLRDNLTVGHMYTTCKADNMLKVWGAGMYEPESFDGFYVDFVEAQELNAGYGYLFVAEAPVVYTIYGENHENTAVEGAPNGMQGTLEQITLPEGNNYCGVKNNHLQYFGAGNQMTAEHAYIVIDKISVNPTPASSAARRLRVGPDRAMPTGNDNVTFNESEENMKFIHNNHFFILREHKLFNAQGATIR